MVGRLVAAECTGKTGSILLTGAKYELDYNPAYQGTLADGVVLDIDVTQTESTSVNCDRGIDDQSTMEHRRLVQWELSGL